MAQIISISNQKGGVAKTTTTQSLSVGLIKRGFSVLLIDLDPQKNLSSCVQANLIDMPNIFDLLICQAEVDLDVDGAAKKINTKDYIQKTHSGDIIPSTSLLSTADMKFISVVGREELLKEALSGIKHEYDYILIDTPPALSTLTINAFAASNSITIPMRADEFSMEGLGQLYTTIKTIRKKVNPNLIINGILLTIHNPRTAISKALTEQVLSIAEKIGTKVYNTYIRQSVSVQEAQLEKANILEYSPRSTAQIDYKNFIDEFLNTTGATNG